MTELPETTSDNTSTFGIDKPRSRTTKENLITERNVLNGVYAFYLRAANDPLTDVAGAAAGFVNTLAHDNFELAYQLAMNNLTSDKDSRIYSALNSFDVLLIGNHRVASLIMDDPKNDKIFLSIYHTARLTDEQLLSVDPDLLFRTIKFSPFKNVFEYRRVVRAWIQNDPQRAQEEFGNLQNGYENYANWAIPAGKTNEAIEKVTRQIAVTYHQGQKSADLLFALGRLAEVKPETISQFVVSCLKDPSLIIDYQEPLASVALRFLNSNQPLSLNIIETLLTDDGEKPKYPAGQKLLFEYIENFIANPDKAEVNLREHYETLVNVFWNSYEKHPTEELESVISVLLPGVFRQNPEQAYEIYLKIIEDGLSVDAKTTLLETSLPWAVRDHTQAELKRIKKMINNFNPTTNTKDGIDRYLYFSSILKAAYQFIEIDQEFCRKLLNEVLNGKFKNFQRQFVAVAPRLVKYFPDEISRLFLQFAQDRETIALSWIVKCDGEKMDETILTIIQKYQSAEIDPTNLYPLIPRIFDINPQEGLKFIEYMLDQVDWFSRANAASMLGEVAQKCNFNNYLPPEEIK